MDTQVTRQRSGIGRPSVDGDRPVRRLCPNHRNKSDRKENARQSQLCSMPASPPEEPRPPEEQGSAGASPSRRALPRRLRLSSGDTIPNCLGEFREIRESKQRTGIAPYSHPAGTLGATLALSASGHERMVKGPTAASKEQRIDFSAGIAWFGDILNIEAPFVEIGSFGL